MATDSKKTIRPQRARLIAALLLLAGILLGTFVAPRFADRFLQIAGFTKISDFRFQNFKLNLPYRLGLDIQGGTHLVYQADLSAISTPDQNDSMQAVRDVIERRVNLFGVTEPLVQVEHAGKDWRLIVELAGIRDVNAAIRLIGETPFLEFKEERPQAEREQILKDHQAGRRQNEDPYFVSTGLTGRYLKHATLNFGQTTFEPQIGLELTNEGGKLFQEITRRSIGKRVAIYLDGAPISAPVVREEISGGRAQITGNFTPESAKELVGRLNAGALPVPIKLIGQESVGASLGSESLALSLRAGAIGFLAVALFMVVWYRLPGLLAVLALLLYIEIVLTVFKLIPVTLTIAGIAGVILSIGMAVDANILIFERMKEEMRKGKSLEDAVREGFGRAWTSIRDSNISSLITSVILYWLGTNVVKGFALTLSIGVLISMFSAISVTRTLLLALMTKRLESARGIFMSGFTQS